MDDKKREEIALFRYSLIVPFLSQEELEWGVKGELVQRMVKQINTIPCFLFFLVSKQPHHTD